MGTNLGRYVVLGTVGAGAMGRVLRAYDPKLQREVALKLVSDRALDTDARAATLREARAMAQLSHANVVAVYDAEDLGLEVVVVMEYLAGQTLRAWVQASDRPWREVMHHYLAAGRGLAAAHAAGLLHRDFKPANVLVSSEGAIKVTDFGLAKNVSAPHGDAGDNLGSTPAPSQDDSRTDDGTVMGTPRYMAPEQHRGEAVGARADQYSYCVALWEALVGAPPFAGRNSEGTLLANKERGAPGWPSGASAVPRVLVDALRRGLAADPAERWPDMDALLATLSVEPWSWRARGATALVGLGAVAMLGLGWQALSQQTPSPCTGAAEHLVGVWDDARRSKAHAALSAVDAPYVQRAWEQTRTELDHYASEWVSLHTRACEATTIRGEVSAGVMDLKMACLQRAKTQLNAAAEVLTHADATVARNTTEVVDSLLPLDRCTDLVALAARVDPPDGPDVAIVDEIRQQLAQARAKRAAGLYEPARQVVDHAKQRLKEIGYGPVQTEVWLEHGEVLERLGKPTEAERSLRRALELAATWNQRTAMQRAAEHLMYVVGNQNADPEHGLRYWELASGLAQGQPRLEASATEALGLVRTTQGRYAEAEAAHRRALAIWDKLLGSQHPRVAAARNNLATVLGSQHRRGEALAQHREALAVWEQTLGPHHPHVAASRANIAGLLHGQGNYEAAAAEFRQVRVLLETMLGPEHPTVALVRNNLASCLAALGRHTEAEQEHRAVLAMRERILGPHHPDIAQSLNNLGNALRWQDRYLEAERMHRRAVAMWDQMGKSDHPDAAMSRSNLGLELGLQGKHREAEEHLRLALHNRSQALRAGHPLIADAQHNLGENLFMQEQIEPASEFIERAWAIRRQTDEVLPVARAETAFLLARTLWVRNDASSRGRAHTLAVKAQAYFGEAGADSTDDAREVEQWLRAHQPDAAHR